MSANIEAVDLEELANEIQDTDAHYKITSFDILNWRDPFPNKKKGITKKELLADSFNPSILIYDESRFIER